MNLKKKSIKKINETKRNYNEKNEDKLKKKQISGIKLKIKSIRRRVKSKININ
jgi:hypothetical protein